MEIDLDFFSVLTAVEALAEICPLGVTLASRRGHNLRDERVEELVQLVSEPLYIFARVERDALVHSLSEQKVVVVPNENELVLCSEGLLKVDVSVLQRSLVNCGCMRVFCYQYGLKSRNLAYWRVVDALCLSVPSCAENKFHISRSFNGADEAGIDHICLFKGFSLNGFVSVQRFPLLKDLGNGFGGCDIRDNISGVTLTVYATVIHVLKRHGIFNLKVPKSVADCGNLLRRLEAFYETLCGYERSNIGGFRFELLCEAATPSQALSLFGGYLDPSVWIKEGSLSAYPVEVGDYLEMIRRALEEFRHLGVARGDGSSQLSIYRKFICTDLLNYFGLCKPTMIRFLSKTGSSTTPFTKWEFWMSNEELLVRRIGRVRGERRTRNDNPNVQRHRDGGFTAEEDRLIIAAFNSRSRSKWEDLRGRHTELFASRTATQLKDRYRHIAKTQVVVRRR